MKTARTTRLWLQMINDCAEFPFSWTRCHGNQRSEVSFVLVIVTGTRWCQHLTAEVEIRLEVQARFWMLFVPCSLYAHSSAKTCLFFVLFFFSLHKVKTSKCILLNNKLCPYVTTPILFNLYSECLTKEALDGLEDTTSEGKLFKLWNMQMILY